MGTKIWITNKKGLHQVQAFVKDFYYFI